MNDVNESADVMRRNVQKFGFRPTGSRNSFMKKQHEVIVHDSGKWTHVDHGTGELHHGSDNDDLGKHFGAHRLHEACILESGKTVHGERKARAALHSLVQDAPEAWHTANDVARRSGQSYHTAKRHLDRFVERDGYSHKKDGATHGYQLPRFNEAWGDHRGSRQHYHVHYTKSGQKRDIHVDAEDEECAKKTIKALGAEKIHKVVHKGLAREEKMTKKSFYQFVGECLDEARVPTTWKGVAKRYTRTGEINTDILKKRVPKHWKGSDKVNSEFDRRNTGAPAKGPGSPVKTGEDEHGYHSIYTKADGTKVRMFVPKKQRNEEVEIDEARQRSKDDLRAKWANHIQKAYDNDRIAQDGLRHARKHKDPYGGDVAYVHGRLAKQHKKAAGLAWKLGGSLNDSVEEATRKDQLPQIARYHATDAKVHRYLARKDIDKADRARADGAHPTARFYGDRADDREDDGHVSSDKADRARNLLAKAKNRKNFREEALDELTTTKLKHYVSKAMKQGALGYGYRATDEKDAKRADKRSKGVSKASEIIRDRANPVKPKVHDLSHMSDGEVYDHTQTSNRIKDGHVLKLAGGRTAIMMKAWPTMVKGDSKHLHQLAPGSNWRKSFRGRYAGSAKLAEETIAEAKIHDKHKDIVAHMDRRYQDVHPDLPAHGEYHYASAIDHLSDNAYDNFRDRHKPGLFKKLAKHVVSGYASNDTAESARAEKKRYAQPKVRTPRAPKPKKETSWDRKPLRRKGVGSY